MDSIKKVTVSWSGGKDAAFALYKILHSKQYKVVCLHTVIDAETKRVGMHGVREELIQAQARALNLPLEILYLQNSEGNEKYEELIRSFYSTCAANGISAVIFGDIFLEDLRRYRDTLLTSVGLAGIYPLWKADTATLVIDFAQLGFKTLLCSANAAFFSEKEVGQTIDYVFCERIPPEVDPCGEHGEFHTFVYDGPLFTSSIKLQKTEVIKRHYAFDVKNNEGTVERRKSYFWFQELLPL